jgi:hypothetical protein
MKRNEPLGEWPGYHADPAWDRPTVCWGECSDCLAGAHRYEDEEVAEKVLSLLRHWSSNCADTCTSI